MNPSFHRLRNALLAFALMALLSDLAPGIIWISPDAHTKSRFMRNYNPMVLIATFEAPCSPGAVPVSGSQSNAQAVTALHENLVTALHQAGCRLTDDRLSNQDGLEIHYQCSGRTIGIITAAPPLKTAEDGDPHVKMIVKIDERWSVRG